jgi:hypothetical protein
VRHEPAFDDARHDAVAGELTGSQEASRARADDQDLMAIVGISGHRQSLIDGLFMLLCMRRATQAKGPAQQSSRVNGLTRRLR